MGKRLDRKNQKIGKINTPPALGYPASYELYYKHGQEILHHRRYSLRQRRTTIVGSEFQMGYYKLWVRHYLSLSHTYHT